MNRLIKLTQVELDKIVSIHIQADVPILLEHYDLDGLTLKGNFTYGRILHCNLFNCNMSFVNLRYGLIADCSIRNTDLSNSNLERCWVENSEIAKCIMKNAILDGCYLKDCSVLL